MNPKADKRNPLVDAYLGRSNKWREELEQLRTILLDCPLTEELKWGKPCYTFEGSNVVILMPLKECCALLFAKGALLNDAHGILIQPTANTQAARQVRFTNAREIAGMATVVKAYIREAVEAEKAGLEVSYKDISEFAVPEELQSQLDEDAALKTAFRALTPGRQRGYLLYFSAAKQSRTRASRVEKCREQILAGKGLRD